MKKRERYQRWTEGAITKVFAAVAKAKKGTKCAVLKKLGVSPTLYYYWTRNQG